MSHPSSCHTHSNQDDHNSQDCQGTTLLHAAPCPVFPTDHLTLTMFTMTLRGTYYHHPIVRVRKLKLSKFK